MTDDFDRLPDELRASLARHAADAPRGDVAAERIIHAAGRAPAPDRRFRSWRTWSLPLVAAGAVAAVVGAVVGIESYHSHGSHPQVAASKTATVSEPTPTPSESGMDTATSSTAPIDAATLHGVKILDLSFAGQDDGWALASADCVNGGGRCTALLRTTDGKKWTSMPGAAFNVTGVKNCAAPCVSNIRFVNDQVGYAFGPSALLMTTDGGHHWTTQAGGALFLESLDGNVIRVTTSGGGCPAACFSGVETALNGSSHWTRTTLDRAVVGGGFGMSFSRGGSDAYLLSLGHPAGGGGSATSTLFRSTDNGQHWTSAGEPCPQTDGEVDSYAIAAAPAGRVSVLCANRLAPQHWFVATSSDAGAHFVAQPGGIPTRAAGPWDTVTDPGLGTSAFAGDPQTVLVTGGNGVAVSTNGGRSWSTPSQPTGIVTFLGFESAQVGRAVTDQHTIWTTRDAGRTWSKVTFG